MRRLIVLLVSLIAAPAFAGSLDELKSFLTNAKTLKANFEQTVTDHNGKVIQQSTGSMEFSRPGKFRWQYVKPYEQLIVGDGVKLWLYDPDLNQVTVRKLDKAIGSSPAALLAGDAEIEKNFNLKDAGTANKLTWVEATPKSLESTFERVRMGFAGSELSMLELKDNFGQNTVIKLAHVQLNNKPLPAAFTFVPPKGADVISD
ncbi:MAG: outer membrane lipoprotein chaperone LolA [Pseudomonadota bacterium]